MWGRILLLLFFLFRKRNQNKSKKWAISFINFTGNFLHGRMVPWNFQKNNRTKNFYFSVCFSSNLIEKWKRLLYKKKHKIKYLKCAIIKIELKIMFYLPHRCTNHWHTDDRMVVLLINQPQTIHVNSLMQYFSNPKPLHPCVKRTLYENLIKYLVEKSMRKIILQSEYILVYMQIKLIYVICA